jgi:hypothetical protein
MCDNTTLNGGFVGILYRYVDPSTGDLYIAYVTSLSLVDNTYGKNSHNSWALSGKSHSFKNLTGSDKAQFLVTRGDGSTLADFTVDYITASTAKSTRFPSGFPSGYGSLGAAGGDGKVNTNNTGDSAFFALLSTKFQAATSIDYNFNLLPCVKTTDSPQLVAASPANSVFDIASPPEAAACNPWVFEVVYEFRMAGSAFGASGAGTVDVVGQHISPNKLTQNLIVPDPCGCITGKVVDCAGVGIPGVPVTITGPAPATTMVTVNTDSQGMYEVNGLKFGSYTVSVPSSFGGVPIQGPNSVTVTLSSVLPCAVANFIYCQQGMISGTVRDCENHPIPGVTVTLTGPVNTSTTTAADGTYKFNNLPIGTYQVCVPLTVNTQFGTLTVTPPQCRTVILTSAVPSASGVDFVYCTPCTIRGVVLDCNNVPLQGVPVTLTGPAGGTVFTLANGSYEFNNLPLGTYQVCVPATFQGLVIAQPCQTVTLTLANCIQQVNFVYQCPGSIKVTVQCQDGTPLANVPVTMTCGTTVITLFTASNGMITFQNVPLNVQCMICVPTTHAGNPIIGSNCCFVTLTPSNNFATCTFTYNCPPPPGQGCISGTVLCLTNVGGQLPFAGRTVTILNSLNQVVALPVTDAQGMYQVCNLPLGTYQACVPTTVDFNNDFSPDLQIFNPLGGCQIVNLTAGTPNASNVNFSYLATPVNIGVIEDVCGKALYTSTPALDLPGFFPIAVIDFNSGGPGNGVIGRPVGDYNLINHPRGYTAVRIVATLLPRNTISSLVCSFYNLEGEKQLNGTWNFMFNMWLVNNGPSMFCDLTPIGVKLGSSFVPGSGGTVIGLSNPAGVIPVPGREPCVAATGRALMQFFFNSPISGRGGDGAGIHFLSVFSGRDACGNYFQFEKTPDF